MTAPRFTAGDRIVCTAAAKSQPATLGLHATLVERAPAGRRFTLPDGSIHDMLRCTGYWVCKLDAPLKVQVFGAETGRVSSTFRLYVCIPQWLMQHVESVDGAGAQETLQ